MDILGAKGAAEKVHEAVDSALDKVTQEAIPAAEQAGKSLEDHAVYGLYGLVADLANRLNGAECPVDISIDAHVRIHGKVGQLKLTVPEYDAKP